MSCTRIMLLALALTIAPVMARSEERGPPAAPTPQAQPGEPATVDHPQGTPPDHSGTETRGVTGWTGAVKEQKQTGADVGSRALTGPQERAADQPEMATGADLKGPPMRFAPADTPE